MLVMKMAAATVRLADALTVRPATAIGRLVLFRPQVRRPRAYRLASHCRGFRR